MEEALKEKEKDCADALTIYQTSYNEFGNAFVAAKKSLSELLIKLKEAEIKKNEVVKDNLRKFVIFESRSVAS